MNITDFTLAINANVSSTYVECHPNDELHALKKLASELDAQGNILGYEEHTQSPGNKAHEALYSLFQFDLSDGLKRVFYLEDELVYLEVEDFNPRQKAHPLASAFNYIRRFNGAAILFAIDVDEMFPGVNASQYSQSSTREFKTLHLEMSTCKKRVVFIGQLYRFESNFAQLIQKFEFPLPTGLETRSILTETFEAFKQYYQIANENTRRKVPLPELNTEEMAKPGFFDDCIRASSGLSRRSIESAINLSVGKHHKIGLNVIQTLTQMKFEELQKHGIQYSPPPTVEIGGMENLKSWLLRRSKILNLVNKEEYSSMPLPKGIFLVGPPGTGKSLVPKTIGATWNMPVLKMEISSMLDSLVGSSEANLRVMFRMAEYVSPCVLWIDEIDKTFSNVLDSKGTNGLIQRLFGDILTWMQEKQSWVFVVATANRVENLPPELLRRGRFDEVFYTSLPNQAERLEILSNHLARHHVDPNSPNSQLSWDDVVILADSAVDYSGAELQAVVDNAYTISACEDRMGVVTYEDLVQAMREIIPLAVTNPDVYKLSESCKQFQPASKPSVSVISLKGDKNGLSL